MVEPTKDFVPGSVLDKLGQKVRENISKAGVNVWSIFGSQKTPTFAYTTGMAEKNLPEFLIVGFAPEDAHHIIMSVVMAMKERGRRFEHGEQFFIDDDPEKVLVFFDARDSVKDDFTLQTGQYYQTQDYEVQQILIPDTQGRFPNDPACEYHLQPILSREPVAATSVKGLSN